MGSFKLKKTTKHKRSKHHGPAVEPLPKDLWTEIFARVVSTSFTDLFNAKLSCKDFYEIMEEDCILEHVSLGKFHTVPWNLNTKASAFFERCKESGNPELLYREGMDDYFSYGSTKSGFEYLKRAMKKGHVEATYAYAIILLCSEGQSKQQGMKILSSLKAKSGRFRMNECRKRMKTMVWNFMWRGKNIIIDRQHALTTCVGEKPCKLQKINLWLTDDEAVDEYDDVLCEACRCNREVTWFYNLQNGRPYLPL